MGGMGAVYGDTEIRLRPFVRPFTLECVPLRLGAMDSSAKWHRWQSHDWVPDPGVPSPGGVDGGVG